MRRSIDFPRDIPAPAPGAQTVYRSISPDGVRSLEAQGLIARTADDLTPRVASLEIEQARRGDVIQGLIADNLLLAEEFRVVSESLRAEVDALRDELRAATLKVA